MTVMLNSYKTLNGSEVFYWNGEVSFWLPDGVYTVIGTQIHSHGSYTGPRDVEITIKDKATGYTRIVTRSYPDEFDDYEIIHRWLFGAGACDCQRGKALYEHTGVDLEFGCSKNKYVVLRLAIKGKTNCILNFKRFGRHER